MAISLGMKSVHDERRLLKWIFGIGIAFITFFLAVTNGTGAWVETKSWAFTGLAIGAEIALVAAFSLIILGETRWRQAVGAMVFVGLAWFCVENGKAAVKHWMDDVFVGSVGELEAKAALMNAEAEKLDTLPEDTKTEASEQRKLDREELAALNVELDLMKSDTEAGIRKAQISLKAMGLYDGPIDGIRGGLTEEAMLARGEVISSRIAVLQSKLETGGAQNDAVAALAPAQTARLEAIKLTEQAATVEERERWAQILLLVAEAARSFGVWAFLMAGTRDSARYGRRATDREDDEPEAAAPEPPKAEPPPQPEPEPQSDPIDDAIDQATGTPPKKPVGNPSKAGDSTAFNHDINKVDDSLAMDASGIADMERAA